MRHTWIGVAMTVALAVARPTQAAPAVGSWTNGALIGSGTGAFTGTIGFPGLELGYLRGMSDTLDLGGRFSFNYGGEGLPNAAALGLKLALDVKYKLEINLPYGTITARLLPGIGLYFPAGFTILFLQVPAEERMFIKHRVTQPEVIRDWCQNIDLGRNLPLLALHDGQIIADATLHQQLGGWKRHIGRVSVMVHPKFRGRGLAKALVHEVVEIARHTGLKKLEAEFIGEQDAAIKMFALLGFSTLVRLPEYVKDMQAINHDYILMGLELATDEEYAGMG